MTSSNTLPNATDPNTPLAAPKIDARPGNAAESGLPCQREWGLDLGDKRDPLFATSGSSDLVQRLPVGKQSGHEFLAAAVGVAR